MLRFLIKRTAAARGRRIVPAVSPGPTPVQAGSDIPFDVPRYPPADPGLPVVPAASVVASQGDLIARLRDLCGFDEAGFAAHVLAPVDAVARCIHLLPASSHDHFAGPGGLFRLCLEMALFSRQAAQAHLVAPTASAEARRALEPRWRHACLLAGLLSELPRPLSTMVVTDEVGRVWPACLGGLEPWLQRVQADRYHVAWLDRPPTGGLGGEAASVLGDLVPKATLAWLNEASPWLVPAMFRVALGPSAPDGGDDIGRLVQATRRRVLDVEAVTRRSRYGRLRIGHHLELHLVDAMRHRVATGQWVSGQAPLWWGLDGLFLEWPAAADTVRHDVIRNGLRGVPLCAFTLAEVLGHSGLLVPAAPGQWLWRIHPEEGGEPRVAMKFTDPRAVLGHLDGIPTPRLFAQAATHGAQGCPPPVPAPPPAPAALTPVEVRMVDTWRACLEAGRRDLVTWLPGRGLALSQDLLALSGTDVASVATLFERRRWLGQGEWASPSARAGVLPFDGMPKPGVVLNDTGLVQLGLRTPAAVNPPRIFNAFRPVHEARAAVLWALAAGHGVMLAAWLGVDVRVAGAIVAGASLLAGWRALQARALWRFKIGLAGGASVHLPCDRFDAARARLQGQLWLGWGYRWQPAHTQLCHDMLKRSLHEVYPPAWLLRLQGLRHDPAAAKGLGWVQGLAPERDVVVPMAALEGHTAVLAVTGALKTVLARLLVYQLASRGDTVFVLDPKGDKGLEQVCRDVTERLGEPARFARFHTAFPSQSFRFDALANWDRETQVASRIRQLMGGSPEDPFNAFVWTTVTDIVRAMKRLGRRVTLQSLLDTVRSQDTAEALAEEVLQAYFDSDAAGDGDPAHAATFSSGSPGRRQPPASRGPFANPRLAHWVHRFRTEVPPSRRPADLTGLIASLEAERSWFAKMVVGLTPVLMRLTAGDLGPLLSPDHADVTDPRPVLTTRQLVEGRRVVYFGLDALSDTSVAEGLAALVLSDLAATAGDLYNHGPAHGTPPRRVHVLCDEWGDLVCEPVVQLANKGRGAGIVLYLFGQTVSDLVVKLGDEARAKRILGNMNNFIVGATSDTDTLDFITRKLGETVVRRTTVSHGAGQKTEDAGLEYAATRQSSVTEQALALVPPQVLAGLPDLHYVAIVNRAQVYKGRIPVLGFEPPVAAG